MTATSPRQTGARLPSAQIVGAPCHLVVVSTATDWDAWHRPYDDANSSLSRRLRIIQTHIADWLDNAPRSAPLAVLSSCSGDGRDLLEVLASRTDADRVAATLLESDSRNVERARQSALNAGLANVTVRHVDATSTDAYAGAVPADLVLLCGIFGNIADDDVERLIRSTPQLCNSGATLIWTRHTKTPDLTPRIRGWFRQAGFAERAFAAPHDAVFSVGCEQFRGQPEPLAGGQRLFTFIR